MIQPKKGIHVVPYGWTEDTKEDRDSGNSAIRNILSSFNYFEATKVYDK